MAKKRGVLRYRRPLGQGVPGRRARFNSGRCVIQAFTALYRIGAVHAVAHADGCLICPVRYCRAGCQDAACPLIVSVNGPVKPPCAGAEGIEALT